MIFVVLAVYIECYIELFQANYKLLSLRFLRLATTESGFAQNRF